MVEVVIRQPPGQRVECFQGAAMDVEGIGQELADRRVPAGDVDGLGVPSPEELIVGQAAFLKNLLTLLHIWGAPARKAMLDGVREVIR